MLNTVKKVSPVLELFTPEQPAWRLGEIAAALEMPKSSVHSLVSALVDAGLLVTDEQRTYQLGWGLLLLEERLRCTIDVAPAATVPMRDLADEVRETVFLAELNRGQAHYLMRVESASPHPNVRLAGVQPGARLPLHATATGKVLLHDRDDDDIRWILEATELRALTRSTLTDVDEVLESVLLVRERGVGLDRGEMLTDVCCVSAPIWDRYECVVAALTLQIPGYRFEVAADLIGPLRAAAGRVSLALGVDPAHLTGPTRTG